MLQACSYDDVFELCRSVRMDPSRYKPFDFALTVTEAPAQDAVTHPEGEWHSADQYQSSRPEAPVFSAGPAIHRKPEPVRLLPSSSRLLGEAKPATEVPDTDAAGTLRSASVAQNGSGTQLPRSSTGTDLSALSAVHARMAHQPFLLPLVSGVGGCGATTVLAALGRALSILGERVLLVDARGPSTLDCFYQAQSHETGLLLSTDALSQFEGRVHVLRTHLDAPSGGQSSVTKFHRATAGLQGSVDRILVASTEWFPPALQRRTWASGTCLMIVTPELRSVLAVPTMLQVIAERSRQAGVEIEPWFVLNRFDEASASHIAMRSRLAAQLGPRLLPFAIPETDLVEQALIEGVSVLDLAPQSPFADACFNLADWYRAESEKVARLTSQAEENQLVSE